MLAILNSLNAYNLPIFQPTLLILVSKFMIHRILYDKTYLSLGLLSPLISLANVLSLTSNRTRLIALSLSLSLSLSLYDYEPQHVVTDTTQRTR